jgi:hypothetical protein
VDRGQALCLKDARDDHSGAESGRACYTILVGCGQLPNTVDDGYLFRATAENEREAEEEEAGRNR